MESNLKIRNFIENNLSVFEEDTEFNDDDNIFELGFINSMLAMKLIVYIEQEFDLEIDNRDLDIKNFNSITKIVNFIESKTMPIG